MVTRSESRGATVAIGEAKQPTLGSLGAKVDAHMLSNAQPTGEAPITSSTPQEEPQLVEVKVVGPNVASVIHPVQVPYVVDEPVVHPIGVSVFVAGIGL
jgi:hypothetical protein